MEVNEAKNKIQIEALKAWKKNKYKGTCELCTGAGKTRIAIMAISRFAKESEYNFKALIIVPTTAIQHEWEKEFKKWNELIVFKKCVQVECINTARKFKGKSFGMVVLDEAHRYLKGEVNTKFFKNNTYDKIMGLSATIEDNLLEYLNPIAPICYSLNLYDAVELGLVSEFTIYNIPVDLTVPERKAYDKCTSAIKFAWENYSQHSWKNISTRKEILYNAKAKLKVINKLVNIFGKKEYGVIFSMTKDYANKVQKKLGETCLTQHSGITKKKRIEGLKRFSDGRTKVRQVSTAVILDEGINIPRVSYAIISSNSSKVRQMTQRVGRLIRLGKDNKHAIIIRLYCKDTQEEKWVHTSQAKVNSIDVENIEELIKLIKLNN